MSDDTQTNQIEALRQQVRALNEQKDSFLRKEELSKSMITELEGNVENYRRENDRLTGLFNAQLDFDAERGTLTNEIDELKQKLSTAETKNAELTNKIANDESKATEFVGSLNSVINQFAGDVGGSSLGNLRKRPRTDTPADADQPHSSTQANNREISVFTQKIVDLEQQLLEQKNNYECQIGALAENIERLQTNSDESQRNAEQQATSQARIEELLTKVHELESNLRNTESELYAEYDITEAFATCKTVLQPLLNQIVDTVLDSCQRMDFNGLREEAVQLLQRAGRIEENGRKDQHKLRSIWEQMYYLAWETENYNVALEATTKCIALSPNTWLLYSRRSNIHQRLGNHQAAREDVARVRALING
ncbi:hypothetical protein M3Y97_00309000 [Aphelenchoides bicaudatus]|nr:hypothetical protein M3Y97_00309000 [Aphelenchoides bicaudatus]